METRSRKQGVVWGGLLIFFGVMSLLETMTELGPWTWVTTLAAAGLLVFFVFLADRSDWGLLIPAYVLWAVAGMIALIQREILRDEMIAFYVLSAIALPFLVGFLRDTSRWGLLIPAYVLLAVGLMVALIGANVLDDLLIPAYVMFAIAIPFLVVFLRDRENWWALIPGGIMGFIGLSFLLAEGAAQYIFPIAVILVGVGILARQFLGRKPPPAEELPEPDFADDDPPLR